VLDARQRRLCALLGDLLSYPASGSAAAARALAAEAGPESAAATRFCRHAGASELAALQELYTTTFDLQPACAPYFGHQLLGDSPLRGPLLAQLADLYRAEGFQPREELADHVAEVLRFLSVARPGAARDALLQEGLLPAVQRMIESFEGGENPYRDLLVAVHEVLGTPGAPITDAVARQEVRT
jgi:nitrate reductase molybdenum cofactor assembly chaperone NarJ/NarW